MPDAEAARRIRDDAIDILVDLNGHTAHNRLPLFFLKPAPVQATWLGYLGSTGVPTIDYRLTDRYTDPTVQPEAAGAEALWRLPLTQWCYRPYVEAPDVGPLPASTSGGITFVCMNHPLKSSRSAFVALGAHSGGGAGVTPDTAGNALRRPACASAGVLRR